MKRAVYPGSFDPITNGHLDIIKRANCLFDEVIVAVIANPEKQKPHFSLEDRVQMLKDATKGLKGIKIDSFHGLLVDYTKKIKSNSIIRGLRAVSDFDYEFQMALTNRRLCPNIETVFLMTDYKYSYLSSSIVKQIAHLKGNINGLVPKNVATRLKNI